MPDGGGVSIDPRNAAAPGANPGATHQTKARAQHTPGLDPIAALDAEARRHGARIATRCTRCGAWLVDSKSRAAHRGPKCRKAVGA